MLDSVIQPPSSPHANGVVALAKHATTEQLSFPSIPASEFTKNTHNPIRAIIDGMRIEPHPEKQLIALSIGDPTIYGNLKPHDSIINALLESVNSMKYNGYAPTTGYPAAREAVAQFYDCPEAPVTAQDVILCSGCSSALDMCILALASRGQHILVPRPGFSIYRTLGGTVGIGAKYYNLLPEKGWEVDLRHLESLIDSNTAAIVVNNPSNPCGSVFSASHLSDILDIAAKYKLPIIADEIYDYFVFKGETFVPIAKLSRTVPILTCSGLTKRFLVPGWRMGWILIHDRCSAFKQEVRSGLQLLTQRIIGSNTIVQGALPAILKNTPESFFDDTIEQVQKNAELAFKRLSDCPGLKPIKPRGAMYMMVGIDMNRYPDFETEFQFLERLICEQSVFCLPGKCFEYPGYFRIVLTVPQQVMQDALDRIQAFSSHYYTPDIRPHDCVQLDLISQMNFQGGIESVIRETSTTFLVSKTS